MQMWGMSRQKKNFVKAPEIPLQSAKKRIFCSDEIQTQKMWDWNKTISEWQIRDSRSTFHSKICNALWTESQNTWKKNTSSDKSHQRGPLG